MTKPLPHDASWDAGEMGCGELVFELKMRFAEMNPGALFHLIALDTGAMGIPAWCRLTGHSLVEAQHPHYWIRKKPSKGT